MNEEEQWSIPIGMEDVNPWLAQATIAVEDHRFYSHHGVDPVAVLRAIGQNLWRGRIYSGASTITMQLVRMVNPRPRSYVWKILQAVEAVRLDLRMDKDEILHLYLNRAPYGMNLQGCEAASLRYWGKPTRELALGEAALLAGLPKSPSRLMPLKHPERAHARRNLVLRRMHEEGVISQDLFKENTRRATRVAWHDFPRHSLHAASYYFDDFRVGAVVETTLDYKIQTGLERLIETESGQLDKRGLNCAVLVSDVSSGAVLGWIGSKGFFNPEIDGQVDCTRALRSPGSAMKPFAFALAMDRNRLYPNEGLRDDPLDYGLYRPENMDGMFRGVIPASTALRQSLNIPAMTVLERLGIQRFCGHLRSLGITSLFRPDPEYGMGLILGNCEVSLWELSGAYCTLAGLGSPKSLYWHALDAPLSSSGPRAYQRGTALAMFRIMEQELPGRLELPGKARTDIGPRACWKTGTSTNNRDAWAFVFNGAVVVGVWVGRNDGSGVPGLIGYDDALPLASRVFMRLLPSDPYWRWPEFENAFKDVEICSITGLPASKFCPSVYHDQIPVEQYVQRKCDVHYPSPLGDGMIQARWPSSTQGWDLARVPEPENTEEETPRTGPVVTRALEIMEPAGESVFLLSGEEHGDLIRLRTSLDRVEELFWYMNDQYLGVSRPDQPIMLDLQQGRHKLVCMRTSGEWAQVRFSVVDPAMIDAKAPGIRSVQANDIPGATF
jgi:penicillin-binding protein 1C